MPLLCGQSSQRANLASLAARTIFEQSPLLRPVYKPDD